MIGFALPFFPVCVSPSMLNGGKSRHKPRLPWRPNLLLTFCAWRWMHGMKCPRRCLRVLGWSLGTLKPLTLKRTGISLQQKDIRRHTRWWSQPRFWQVALSDLRPRCALCTNGRSRPGFHVKGLDKGCPILWLWFVLEKVFTLQLHFWVPC